MNKTIVDIKGMHCRSCEILIEDELLKIPSVKKADVSQKKGCAEISYDGRLDENDVAYAIREAGYSLGKDQRHLFSKNPDDYMELGIAVTTLFIIWAVAYLNGWFEIDMSGLNNYASLPIVFLIGLTAGISTCMALIGGLVLGAAARFSEKHPTATPLQKFKPHLFFNLGRIISFFFFGALIGYMGSFFRLSPGTLGFLIILVGVVMLFLGVQLIDIFPKINGMTFTLPKQISGLLGIKKHNDKEYSHTNSMMLGALTFFLPCGFTQAMQLFAMSTGSPVTGALTMGVFAIGTAPGLLSIGGVTSIVKGAFARAFFKFAGVVVIALAFFNITSGFTLTGIKGISLPKFNNVLSASTSGTDTNTQEGLQVIKATYSVANGFQPKELTVKVGVPARLEVDAQDNGAGCMGSITLPGLSQNVEVFKRGQKAVFDFTAGSTGSYTITCAMGLPHGSIKAI